MDWALQGIENGWESLRDEGAEEVTAATLVPAKLLDSTSRPMWPRAIVRGLADDYAVTATIDTKREDSPVIVELEIRRGAAGVSRATTRDLPTGEIYVSGVRAVTGAILFEAARQATGEDPQEPGKYSGPAAMAALLAFTAGQQARAQARAGVPARRTQRLTRAFLEEVAEIYRANEDSGTPTKAVAEHYGREPTTVVTWVRKARQAGLLEPLVQVSGGETEIFRKRVKR